MALLSLFEYDLGKAVWIAQISIVFTRCEGFYKNETKEEINVSFKSVFDSSINLSLRLLPYRDVDTLYKIVISDKYDFLRDIDLNNINGTQLVDLNPKFGLFCVFFNSIYENSSILAIPESYEELLQVNKNLKLNNIINQFKNENNHLIDLQLKSIDISEEDNINKKNILINNLLINICYLSNYIHFNLIDFLFVSVVQAVVIFRLHHEHEKFIDRVKTFIIDIQDDDELEDIDYITEIIDIIGFRYRNENGILLVFNDNHKNKIK